MLSVITVPASPVGRETYVRSVEVLIDAVRSARLGDRTKSEALTWLARHAGLGEGG